MKPNLILLLCALVLSSCDRGTPKFRMPEFPQNVRGEVELLTEDLTYGSINRLYVYGPYLIVAGIQQQNLVNIYDRNTGELLKRTAWIGRGPGEVGEILEGADFDPGTGDLLLVERDRHNTLKFNVNDVAANDTPRLEKNTHEFGPVNWIETVYMLDDERVLLRSATKRKGRINRRARFEMYDGASRIWTGNRFPLQDTVTEINCRNEQYAIGDLNADRTKFFLGTGYNGATLECFDVTSDSLALRWTKYLIAPRYNRQTGEDAENKLRGFKDVSVSGDLVLTVIGDDRQHWVRSVCVFDFEGNPVKRIVIDSDKYNIFKVCMNDAGEMYAVVATNKQAFHLARIRETGPAEYAIPKERIDHFTPESVKNPTSFQ